MRYAYISTPNNKEYTLFHRALVHEKNGRVSLFYYASGLKRHFTVTFKSKEGILLTIAPLDDNRADYHMFIPETNPYFNMNVLADEFPYLDVSHPEVRKTATAKMHAAFRRVMREYKKSSE